QFNRPSESVIFSDVRRVYDTARTNKNWDQQLTNTSYMTSLPANDASEDPETDDASWSGRPRGLHNGLCNVSWIDGHVSSQATRSFYYIQNPTDKYMRVVHN
ncbi:MAG: hypothetical protein GX945_10315, partial [Lentisphaerae bacterium]|nr:hypothetical protein [Lentisphaerota bacterium]